MRVGLISLGCAKNLVDAEIMLGSLLKSGVEITNDAAQADVVIVNTCSFIDSAQEESVDTILESAELREANNRGQGLIVSGCLPQRFREELPKLLPEVDAFMGIDQVAQVGGHRAAGDGAVGRRKSAKSNSPTSNSRKRKVVGALGRTGKEPRPLPTTKRKNPSAARKNSAKPKPSSRHIRNPASAIRAVLDVTARPVYIPDFDTPRFRLTPRHFAYVKIAEGCNHPCSFCIIPRMRGSHRSRHAGGHRARGARR